MFQSSGSLSSVDSTVQSFHLLGINVFRNGIMESWLHKACCPAHNWPIWLDRSEKPFLSLLLPHLFPVTKLKHCWYYSPDLNLLWQERFSVSCKNTAWSPVCHTVLLWREWLTACCLPWFWGQSLSDSAGAEIDGSCFDTHEATVCSLSCLLQYAETCQVSGQRMCAQPHLSHVLSPCKLNHSGAHGNPSWQLLHPRGVASYSRGGPETRSGWCIKEQVVWWLQGLSKGRGGCQGSSSLTSPVPE